MIKNDLTVQAPMRTTTPNDTKNTILFCLFGKNIFIFPRTTAKGFSFLPNENSDLIILGSSGSGLTYSGCLLFCLTGSSFVTSDIMTGGGIIFATLATAGSLILFRLIYKAA